VLFLYLYLRTGGGLLSTEKSTFLQIFLRNQLTSLPPAFILKANKKGGHAVAREENTMTTEQLIKVALSYAGMTQAELADKIGMNKSNFNARMKRESFSRIEMEQIAKALGMEFVYTFKMSDGKTI
jgi:transcriptional regulator with GAF, ATPase, and Fis domain